MADMNTSAGEKKSSDGARRMWISTLVIAFVIASLAGGLIYWRITSSRVAVDSASVEAPEIDLAPSAPGILEAVYVNEGDSVPANMTVARVGDQLIQTKVAGIIVSIPDTIGAQATAGAPVVTMIDPTQLRVVGKVDENKGLNRIKVGDTVIFTVDTFGSKQYSAVIDEISPTSEQSGIVFNISDQREVKQFDVKARFDTTQYPELKNGMSARMWIYGQ